MSYHGPNNLPACGRDGQGYCRDGQGWCWCGTGMLATLQGWYRGGTGVKAGMYRDAIAKNVNNSVNITATDTII